MLATTRLLTITGTGGAGKTRLALQVAAEVLDAFSDGVWLIELAGLCDPVLVPHMVASVLSVPEQPNRPVADTLVGYLRTQSALLVLDNCEHVLSACASLSQVLPRACSDLKILATSREALGVPGEFSLAYSPAVDAGCPASSAAPATDAVRGGAPLCRAVRLQPAQLRDERK